MAMRSVVSSSGVRRLMEGGGRSSASGLRYFSDSKGRILSEEERAKETVYIQVVYIFSFDFIFMCYVSIECLRDMDK